jgi:serine/threonine-protein kinase RsbW
MARRTAHGEPDARGPASADASQLVLTVPSDTSYLHLVSNLARNAARNAGLGESEAGKVALATDEAVTNVIRHAYHGRPGHTIEVRFLLAADGIEVHIVHDGDPIDPALLPQSFDPVALVRGGKKGGLGIVLMQRLMDRVDFRATADDRSECCLTKKRDGQPPEAPAGGEPRAPAARPR